LINRGNDQQVLVSEEGGDSVKLELGNIFIKDVVFSNETKVVDGVLHVNKEAIIEALMQDPRLAKVDIDLAKPGEEVRIIPVKDVIEPRVKVEDGWRVPGFISKVTTVGSGRTHVLKNTLWLPQGPLWASRKASSTCLEKEQIHSFFQDIKHCCGVRACGGFAKA